MHWFPSLFLLVLIKYLYLCSMLQSVTVDAQTAEPGLQTLALGSAKTVKAQYEEAVQWYEVPVA